MIVDRLPDARLVQMTGCQMPFLTSRLKTNPAWWEHTAVYYHGYIVDLTLRQFDVIQPVPLIQELDAYSEKWRILKISD